MLKRKLPKLGTLWTKRGQPTPIYKMYKNKKGNLQSYLTKLTGKTYTPQQHEY